MLEDLGTYVAVGDLAQWATDNRQALGGALGGVLGGALKAWRVLGVPLTAGKAAWKWLTSVPPLSEAAQALLTALMGDTVLTPNNNVRAGEVSFCYCEGRLKEAKVGTANALTLLSRKERKQVQRAADQVRNRHLEARSQMEKELALRALLNATTQPVGIGHADVVAMPSGSAWHKVA